MDMDVSTKFGSAPRLNRGTLPSILDLGRELAALAGCHDQHSQAQLKAMGGSKAYRDETSAMHLLEDRSAALRDLIGTLPANTLADAAVQISVAHLIAAGLDSFEPCPPQLKRAAAILERITLSVLPLMAAAAGLDMAAMEWEQYDHVRASRFYGSECESSS